MTEAQAVTALAALAHPLRLRVFRALVVVGPRGLTAGTIMQGAGVPAATLSFHLKELVSAGLATQEKSGRNIVYRAAYGHMTGLLGFLTAHCCQGSVEAGPCAGLEQQAGSKLCADAQP